MSESAQDTAPDAGTFEMCVCTDCRRHFPGSQLRCYPHGNVCESCHEDRKDNGLTREAFGGSPREPKPELAADLFNMLADAGRAQRDELPKDKPTP